MTAGDSVPTPEQREAATDAVEGYAFDAFSLGLRNLRKLVPNDRWPRIRAEIDRRIEEAERQLHYEP